MSMWDANGTPVELTKAERDNILVRALHAYMGIAKRHNGDRKTAAQLDAQHQVILELLKR